MPLTFGETHGQISSGTIAAFEDKSGLRLPQMYKDFLLQSNGGRPSLTVFEVPNWEGRVAALHFLFGIHSGKHSNLASWFEEHRDRLPEGFLSIGVDMGGNTVCLGTTGEFAGQVWYWDSSNDYENKDGTMFKVGDDLRDFLSKLKEFPEQ